MSSSRKWRGRLFTLHEIDEMFKFYGIKKYEVKRLNEILLYVKIPSKKIKSKPGLSKFKLLELDA